jgi:hypothetical protein
MLVDERVGEGDCSMRRRMAVAGGVVVLLLVAAYGVGAAYVYNAEYERRLVAFFRGAIGD